MGALVSGATAAAFGRRDTGRATAPLNAISHIVWGGLPPRRPGRAGLNTAVGIALHLGASIFWASFFEALFGRAGRRSHGAAACGGAAIAATAFVTDYSIVSERFEPGYERYLSSLGLFAVYAALAAGLAAGMRLTSVSPPSNRR